MRDHKKRYTLHYIICTIAVIIFMFPIFWVAMTSIKTPTQAFQIPPVWWFTPTVENYRQVFATQPFLNYAKNTIIVTVLSTAITMVVGTFAGYSLARFRFRAQRGISYAIFVTKMFPPVVLVVPFFVLFRQVNWNDTYWALVTSHTVINLPFVLWLMWGFFKELPVELEEAAAIDGTSKFGAMLRIALPLSLPGLTASATFSVINSWNEFLFALVLTTWEAKTLSVGAAEFVTQEAILWGPVSAAGTMIMAPLFVFTLFAQKYLVRGLTMGAVK